jgi:hypothetical protein
MVGTFVWSVVAQRQDAVVFNWTIRAAREIVIVARLNTGFKCVIWLHNRSA